MLPDRLARSPPGVGEQFTCRPAPAAAPGPPSPEVIRPPRCRAGSSPSAHFVGGPRRPFRLTPDTGVLGDARNANGRNGARSPRRSFKEYRHVPVLASSALLPTAVHLSAAR